MARSYKVSADTSEKEKIIGGILTIYQGGWIVLGILIAGCLFFLLNLLLPPVAALILAVIPGGTFAVVFAFHKKEGLPFATCLMYQHAFKKQTGKLINTLTFGKDFTGQPPMFK